MTTEFTSPELPALPAPVAGELTAMLDRWSGALISRSRLVDDLLDLRLACAGRPAVQARVDRALGDLPGQNLVAREWAVAVVVDVAGLYSLAEPASV